MERYKECLLSEQWKEKRVKRLEIDGNRCVICGCEKGRDGPLEVHHFTYRHVYHEDIYTDLVTLCPECHMMVHKMMNRITNKNGRRGWRDSLSYASAYSEIRDSGECIE